MLILIAGLALSACGSFEVGLEPSSTLNPGLPTPTPNPTQPAPPTPTLEPTSAVETQAIPTAAAAATDTPLPAATTAAAATQPPTPSAAAPSPTGGDMPVSIVLIGLEDGGKSGPAVGCGDSAIPVTVVVPATQGVLRAAFTALLGLKTRTYGESGLYNALYQSSLALDSLKLENGVATIHLSGSLVLGGECDNPRVKAQLEGTALQFSTVKTAAIYINDQTLDQALSLK